MSELDRRDEQWRSGSSPDGEDGSPAEGSFSVDEGDIGWTFSVDGVYSDPDSTDVPEVSGDLQADAVVSGVSYSKGEIVVTPVEAGVGETYRVPFDFTDGSASRLTQTLPFGSNQTEYSITAVTTEPNKEQTQIRYTTSDTATFEVSSISASGGEGTITVDYTISGESGQSFSGDIFIDGPSIPSRRISGTLGSDGTYSSSESFEVLEGDYSAEVSVSTDDVGVFDRRSDTAVVEGGGSLEVTNFTVTASDGTLTADYTLGGVDNEDFYGSVKFEGPESEYIDISGNTGSSSSASGSESYTGPSGKYLVSMTLGSHDIDLPSRWVDVSSSSDGGSDDGTDGGTTDPTDPVDDGDNTDGSDSGDGTSGDDNTDDSAPPAENETFTEWFERKTGRKPTDPVVLAAGGAIGYLLVTR